MSPGDLTLPSPPGAEGGDVKLTVTQGVSGPFNLQSRSSRRCLHQAPSPWRVEHPCSSPGKSLGKPIWRASQVKVDISHHGGTKGQIDCDVPDTEVAGIFGRLDHQADRPGVAGFPAITLTRVATGGAAVSAGKVELRVLSSVIRNVEVTGFQSSDDTHPCPTGKTCQTGSIC